MNLIKIFKIIFNYPNNEIEMALKSLKEGFGETDTFRNEFLKDHKFIEATDLYLKEIELIVNENIDFNKDKHNIQNLINKFDDIELELSKRFRSKESIIRVFKTLLTGNINPSWIPIYLSEIEEAKKIQRMIIEIRERKSKVDERIKELGINFFLNKIFKSIIFKLKRRMPNGSQYLIYGQKSQK
jgi:hypothetical protein